MEGAQNEGPTQNDLAKHHHSGSPHAWIVKPLRSLLRALCAPLASHAHLDAMGACTEALLVSANNMGRFRRPHL